MKRSFYHQADAEAPFNTHLFTEQNRPAPVWQGSNGAEEARNRPSFFPRRCRCAECIIANSKTEFKPKEVFNTRAFENFNQYLYSRNDNGLANGIRERRGEDTNSMNFVINETLHAKSRTVGNCQETNGFGLNEQIRGLWQKRREKQFTSPSAERIQKLSRATHQRGNQYELEISRNVMSSVTQPSIPQGQTFSFTQLLSSDLQRDDKILSDFWYGFSGVPVAGQGAGQKLALENDSSRVSWNDWRLFEEGNSRRSPGMLTKNNNNLETTNGFALSTNTMARLETPATASETNPSNKNRKNELKRHRDGFENHRHELKFHELPLKSVSRNVFSSDEKHHNLNKQETDLVCGKQRCNENLKLISSKSDVNKTRSIDWTACNDSSAKLKFYKIKSGEKQLSLTHLGSIPAKDTDPVNIESQEICQKTSKTLFEAVEDTGVEACAREERIRNLKALLKEQEKAVEALRCQLKPSLDMQSEATDEITKDSPLPHDTCNKEILDERHAQKKGNQNETNSPVKNGCSKLLQKMLLTNRTLKRKASRESGGSTNDDNTVRKGSTAEKRTPDDSNEDLSNAEYTALVGLVRLSKEL